MYEFNLPSQVPVERVFDYSTSKLAEICQSHHQKVVCTQYGGSACMQNIDGDTFLSLLGEDGRPNTLVPLYFVNPHAGEFVNVGNEQTDHVTIIPRTGKPLTKGQVETIQRELAGLR